MDTSLAVPATPPERSRPARPAQSEGAGAKRPSGDSSVRLTSDLTMDTLGRLVKRADRSSPIPRPGLEPSPATVISIPVHPDR
jgi:hypothetical protein